MYARNFTNGRRAFFDRQRAASLQQDFAAQARAALNFDDSRWEAFKEVQPTIAAWIEAKAYSFDFAANLYGAVLRYGDLTANQYDAVERCIARDRERTTAGREQVDASRIKASFDAAVASGLRRPRITINGFQLSLAPATGKNPGAIYVKDAGIYVGKIVDGVFTPGRDFAAYRLGALQQVCADPAAAARAHGLQTGECSCCGRPLTDPVSVAKGIGPICEGRFGWSF